MKIQSLLLIVCTLATVPLIKAGPPVNYFLKLEGIDGESTDKGHPSEIELVSYLWGGVSNPAPTGPNSSGKVSVGEITVTKKGDKASPKLMLSCVTGSHIKDATITMRKGTGGGNSEFLVIKLKDVIVTSFQMSGDGDDAIDKISLSFSSLTIQAADGSTGQVEIDRGGLQ
jgi:type VI secretion system secreted protein Hcp